MNWYIIIDVSQMNKQAPGILFFLARLSFRGKVEIFENKIILMQNHRKPY